MSIIALAGLCGCGAGAQPVQETTAVTVSDDAGLEAKLQTQEDEMRALKSRLGLAQAKVEELSIRAELPRTESIVIAEAPPIDEALETIDPSDNAERPSLQLHGEASSPVAVGGGELPWASGTSSTADDPVERYRHGLSLIKARKFVAALKQFDTFVRLHPRHAYADNAQYWCGQIYYLRGDYTRALQRFERLIDEHPRGNKVPDALYKMGLIHRRNSGATQARRYFEQLKQRFPNSAAAKMASREDAS